MMLCVGDHEVPPPAEELLAKYSHEFSFVYNTKSQAGLEEVYLLVAEAGTGSHVGTSDSYLLTSTSSSNER